MKISRVGLQSERLVLEPLEDRHASLLYALLSDHSIYRFIPQDQPVSEEALRERYRRLEAGQSPNGDQIWLNWAVRLAKTATYIGTLEATVFTDGSAAIAYIVFAPHRRRGYATEGLERVLDHLVRAHRVEVVIAEIDTRNVASIAMVERLGFVRVDTVQDVDFFKGASSDEYRYVWTPSAATFPVVLY